MIRSEAAELYRLVKNGMTGAGSVTFRDRRHRVIFDCLKHLKGQIGLFACSERHLARFMEEYGYIHAAGGRGYVHRVFRGYEHPATGLLGPLPATRETKSVLQKIFNFISGKGRMCYEG